MEKYIIKKGAENMHLDEVMGLLAQTHWACNRSRETVEKALAHSLCFGIFDEQDVQVGFGRTVTDYATMFYVSDVVIDRQHQNMGLGEMLIDAIKNAPELYHLWGFLGTTRASAFYEKCGFAKKEDFFMALPKTSVDGIFTVPGK